jgi:hypothetical protein
MKKFSLYLFAIFLSSCVQNLDLDQVNDFSLEPILNVPLVYFTITPSQFFDANGANPQNSFSDVTNFSIFEGGFVRNNLVQIDFNVGAKNLFDRAITITIEFLNASDQITYQLAPILVQSGDLNYIFQEVVMISDNPRMLDTSKLKVIVELESTGNSLESNDLSEFEFKSSITAHLENK